MTRILLLENPHISADAVFERYGFEVIRYPGALDEDELIERLKGVDMLGIRSKTNVTRRVIEANPQLTAIGAFCIGTNQIDLEAASEHGLAVFNAPYSNTRSVVEMVVALLIALTRDIPAKNAALHKGLWMKSAAGAHEVRDKTIGIIGYGSIGSQLSVIAEALGMHVLFYDIAEKLALGNAHRAYSLDELLEQADVVSLHIDGRPENTNFFDKAKFDKMKKGSVFINLSRGHVADLHALQEKLDDGTIAGAAVDVFPKEPKANGDPFESNLAGYDNVILTPHIGGSTIEAQKSIGDFVAMKLANYWRKGSTELSVNIPNIATSPSRDSLRRVAWFHHNTPGALASVNQLFANAGANVTYQSLSTAGEYGYMVTDTADPVPDEILEELKQAPAHIRLRVLKREY
ncbi:MAG: phosphoglycerate dehydrogenase [Actinomycetaceae bacterium]|nr:phosphoglycerate dehydrogenase [Actinomycetaceae bacterium]